MTNAFILAFNVATRQSNYYSRHGGETLLNRQLVAMSKSGFKRVWIFTPPGEASRLRSSVEEVEHRLFLTYEVVETSVEQLGMVLSETAFQLSGNILLATAEVILHPTLLRPIVADERNAPALYSYADVARTSRGVEFSSTMAAKFRVIFTQSEGFHTLGTENPEIEQFGLQVATLRPGDFKGLIGIQKTDAIWSVIHADIGRVQPIAGGWWLRIDDRLRPATLKDFFWRIAFKEISGEFSKAVNSKLSKPLSLWFAQHQIAPNTISSLQLVLYLVASLFLVWPQPWTFVAFAIVWQFAAGILDRCDGETARIRNYESEGGAKFDVLIDDLRFLIPFIAIAARLWFSQQDFFYIYAFGLTMLFFAVLTFYELRYMRRMGYLSRQVMGVDYSKSLAPGPWARFFNRFRPLFKGDARTFTISIACLVMNEELIYWLLLVNIVFMAAQGAVLIIQLRRKVKAPTAHNADLIRS